MRSATSKRPRFVFFAAALCVSATATLAAGPSLAPEDVARATGELRRALAEDRPEYAILIGLREEPPASGAARQAPEGEIRARRLARQQQLVGAWAPEDLRGARFHASFSVLAARASREAVLALARRPDVEWVALDGKKRLLQAGPQAAQRLIGSDRANSDGFTGSGFSVAVIDTGVDYDVATLGGVGFPNARVLGGIDTADDDGDPRDCDGHGTSVAGIVGAVAPGAGIVAVKVFRSADAASTTCRLDGGEILAFDSDILQGVDYAVSNRDRFQIAVINLSVGSGMEGGSPVGWCDSRSPAYATAFEAARRAGIAVVVASGNESRTLAVNEPACVSSAISVGAVYAEDYPSVNWSACLDSPAPKDAVACFSNSSPTLSMLAPGAFWQVLTKRSRHTSFAGTSAAAPAVSGAVTLLRQARPSASPAEIAALLRGTGRPVLDSRNAVKTPRLDTFGAVRMPVGAVTVYAGPGVPISELSASASATVSVSGWTGGFVGVQVGVQIDHADPSQLTVSLRGPDGTAVRLHDRGAAPGDGLNAIYGLTEVPVDPLQSFFGGPANGPWTLVVEDHAPGPAGLVRGFWVKLVPGPPQEPVPHGVDGRVLPVVAHVRGTKLFKSDVRLFNPGGPKTLSAYYVAAPQTGESAPRATFSIPIGSVLALNDVILSEYGFDNSIGGMLLLSDFGGFLASSRAYSEGPNGTFGLDIPSFPTSGALAEGRGQAIANGLSKTASLHSNVGFTEVSGSPVAVRMDVVSPSGEVIASRNASAPANGMTLITDIIGDLGLDTLPSFRVDFTVTSPTGRIVPFSTSVDDATGDGLFAAAAVPIRSAEERIVTQAAHVTGANGDFFETNLTITNADPVPVQVTLALLPLQITGPPPVPRVLSLAAGQTLELADLLASQFGLSDPSTAAVRITPSVPARLVVSARTFVRKFGGTFGYFVPSVPASSGLSGLQDQAFALQIEQALNASTGFRTNFGLVEVGGKPVDVLVVARSETGSHEGDLLVHLEPGGFTQGSLRQLIGPFRSLQNGYLVFQVVSGEGRVLPYATVVDNRSGDAIYVAAEKP